MQVLGGEEAEGAADEEFGGGEEGVGGGCGGDVHWDACYWTYCALANAGCSTNAKTKDTITLLFVHVIGDPGPSGPGVPSLDPTGVPVTDHPDRGVDLPLPFPVLLPPCPFPCPCPCPSARLLFRPSSPSEVEVKRLARESCSDRRDESSADGDVR